MKIVLRTIILFLLVSLSYSIQAQDTLPNFAVINRNGKIILSWVNNFSVIKQLSIQRSFDSLKGFKTILTLPDPSSVTNGFLDNSAPNITSFYKLYILLDNGNYLFSKAQKPHIYIPPVAKKESVKPIPKEENINNTVINVQEKIAAAIAPPETKTIVEAAAASKIYQFEATRSSNKKRSDGLTTDTFSLRKPPTFTPSAFVFTNQFGNITIVLPHGKSDNFKIKFYEENGDPVFQINHIKEHMFTLDKSNFMHAGWFRFELFEDGVLKEKNKIRVP